jgi:hypothetical protein
LGSVEVSCLLERGLERGSRRYENRGCRARREDHVLTARSWTAMLPSGPMRYFRCRRKSIGASFRASAGPCEVESLSTTAIARPWPPTVGRGFGIDIIELQACNIRTSTSIHVGVADVSQGPPPTRLHATQERGGGRAWRATTVV